MSSIAIMQPYLFPYAGYFQLIREVDRFIFYDDVNYINRGWINRNKILIDGKAKYFTVPCQSASQNKLINEVGHALTDKDREKLMRKIKFSYGKAPYFDDVRDIIEKTLYHDTPYIGELAMQSVRLCCGYIGLDCSFDRSTGRYGNEEQDAADRLIDICKKEDIRRYVNPIGGKELYEKNYFDDRGISLHFLEPGLVEYEQFEHEFLPWLSIIDIMMFNSPNDIRETVLEEYKLV